MNALKMTFPVESSTGVVREKFTCPVRAVPVIVVYVPVTVIVVRSEGSDTGHRLPGVQ